MFSLRKPSVDALRHILAFQSTLELTYGAVGATFDQTPMPAGYAVDNIRVELGRRRTAFDRAKAGLASWRQFDLGWLQAFPDDTPIRMNESVLVVARAGGVWWTNAARIVHVLDDDSNASSKFGFAYGTLPGHVERGEERFLIEWDHATDIVWFEILAFSRPQHFLVRLNRRRARAMQKRFAAESTAALQRYVAGSARAS
ncbi:MAG TPA: DUF1990 domain-containing protein [Lacipirellulaceae bacterium]|nr:DUF1990 domain-containing protein [Lacipirellulaceae bacterium]